MHMFSKLIFVKYIHFMIWYRKCCYEYQNEFSHSNPGDDIHNDEIISVNNDVDKYANAEYNYHDNNDNHNHNEN